MAEWELYEYYSFIKGKDVSMYRCTNCLHLYAIPFEICPNCKSKMSDRIIPRRRLNKS